MFKLNGPTLIIENLRFKNRLTNGNQRSFPTLPGLSLHYFLLSNKEEILPEQCRWCKYNFIVNCPFQTFFLSQLLSSLCEQRHLPLLVSCEGYNLFPNFHSVSHHILNYLLEECAALLNDWKFLAAIYLPSQRKPRLWRCNTYRICWALFNFRCGATL